MGIAEVYHALVVVGWTFGRGPGAGRQAWQAPLARPCSHGQSRWQGNSSGGRIHLQESMRVLRQFFKPQQPDRSQNPDKTGQEDDRVQTASFIHHHHRHQRVFFLSRISAVGYSAEKPEHRSRGAQQPHFDSFCCVSSPKIRRSLSLSLVLATSKQTIETGGQTDRQDKTDGRTQRE